MKLRLRRPLAMLLTVVMLLGLLPTAAFAVEGEESGEPVTASAPKDITLKNAECEVGDEVTLDGTTTVSDDGTLSYQWYQSGDDFVDEADAADEEKNDTLLEEQTGATLTVDTSEAGTFYYYVIATNTVELADGATTTASTTSNVAMVTVKEAEPVPPSENSEPEDDQEPTDGNASENEQAPENGGEEPARPMENQGESYFATLTLTGFNEATDNTTFSSVTKDLLAATDDTPLKWHLGSTGTRYPATMSINVGSGGAGDGGTRTLTITLAKGLEFVSYPKDSGSGLPEGVTLKEEPKGDAGIFNTYGYSSVYGSLVYEISAEAATKATDISGFMLENITIQPTRAFFTENEDGMTIEDALEVIYSANYEDDTQDVTETKSYDMKLWGAASPKQVVLNSNKHSYVLSPGESVQNQPMWYFEENSIGGQLIKDLTYTIEADEELQFSDPAVTIDGVEVENNSAKKEETQTTDGRKTVTFTASNLWVNKNYTASSDVFYGNTPQYTYQVSVSEDIEPGTYTYQIKSATFSLESGASITIPGNTTVKFTVQNKMEEGDDANFKVGNTMIFRANIHQNEINMTMGGLAWENVGVNDTRPKTVKIQFDDTAVINAVTLPQYTGIADTTIYATLRMADGEVQYVSKDRSDFADKTLITLKEFGKANAVSLQSVTAQVGQLPASSTPIDTAGWVVKNHSIFTQTEYFNSVGHFISAETDSITTTYTVWTTGTDESSEGSNTKTATCTTMAVGADEAVFAIEAVAPSYPETLRPGDTLSMGVLLRQNGSQATNSAPMVQPVLYIRQPKDMAFSTQSLKLYDRLNGKDNGLISPASITDVTRECTVDDGSRIWKVVLPEDYLLGYYDENLDHHALRVEYTMTVLPNASSASLDRSTMLFLTDGSNIGPTSGSNVVSDVYNITGKGEGAKLNGLTSQICTLMGSSQISMGSAIKTDLDENYFNYVEGDNNTVASFATREAGSIRLNVSNNGASSADNVVFYIPLPKADAPYSELFGGKYVGTLDLLLMQRDGEYYTLEGDSVPTVTYATVAAYDSESGLPAEGTTWSNSYSDACNMIRVTYSNIPSGSGESTITFHIKTSDDPDNSGNMSIFYPVIDCQYGNVTQRGKQAPIALQCWSGVVSGTVFDDTDRDGVQDEGEAGVEGITVEVKPENAPSKFATTGEDGKYTVTGVRTDGKVTVTVQDGTHSFNPLTGADARQYSQAVSDPEDGSAYSVVVPIEGTPQNATYTYDAKNNTNASVSAGLIKPYTVTFNGTGNSTVNPSVIYRFPGETVGAYSQRVTVQTGAGENFQDKWSMSVNSGTAVTVEDSALLDTKITGDTVFTPVIESEKNAVYFMVWDNDEGKLVPLAYENIEYGETLGSVTKGQFPDMSKYQRPGYTLTGWNVNGVGIEIINNDTDGRDQILNASVTSMISYHAVYTPLSNIKVTLNPNYEGAESTVLEKQSYGQPINYTIPTREGYTFLGWATTSTATEGRMSLTCPATDTTFYAVWKPGPVRLTLMENGGTWADGSKFENGYIDGTVGEAVNLPGTTDITREGYEFKGWYVQGDTNQAILTDYKFPTKATTLIAKWEPKQESITFNYGEASQIESETVSGPHGSTVGYERGQQLTKDKIYSGYTLTGWTAQDGTVVPAANTGSIVIEDGAIYTAIWAQNQTSLVFDAGSGANFPNNGQTKTYYGSAGETLAPGDLIDPVMTGKTFEGWYTQETGGDKAETFTFPNTGSVTYYAHWKDAEYTVTFNYNGGKVDDAPSSTVKVTHGQMVETVPVPTLSGSTLEGWQNLTTGQTMTEEQIKEAVVTADVIYNAVWSGNSYTVTFSNYNGNPDSVATVTVTEGAAPVAPVVQAPEGKVFLHWSDNATQQTYTAEDLTKLQVKANMDFTAVFGEDSYTITFITSSGSFEGTESATQTTIKKQGGDKLTADDFPKITGSDTKLIGWTCNNKTQTAEQWAGTDVKGSMIFIAVFEGNVTLNLIANGGQFASDAQTTFTGAAGSKIDIPTPTRTGWTFAGWYTTETGGTKITDTSKLPAASAIWYAHWTKGDLTVTVTNPEDQIYDGTAKTPALTVKVGETTLTAGEDYVAIYENYINAGTATVKVYGIEDYADLTGTATFTIKKADQTVTFAKPGKQTAIYGETFANTATAKLDSASAKITYSSSNESIATVNATTGEVTILKAGEVTITATAAATGNVNEGKATYTLTIGKAAPTLIFANSTVSVKTTGSVSNKLTTEPSGLTVTYSSSDPKVATVDAATGKVTLVGEGTTTITATFAGDEKYNGATDTYTLTVDNDAIAYTAEGWHGPYDAQAHSITVTTVPSGATVTYSETVDGNFTAQNPTFTDAGTYTVYFKIEAKGYDAVTGSAKVIIEKAQLTEATVTGGPYTGQQVGSVSEVKAGVLTDLEKDKDYTVILNNSVNAGQDTAMAVITGTGNFTGTLIKTFTITPKKLTPQMVSEIAGQPYTGKQVKPDVTVADGSTTLMEGKDFTVSYGSNNEVGTGKGTVIITGTGNYTDTVTKYFNITNSGTFEVIVDNTTLTYDGTEKTPAVTVWAVSDDGKTKTMLTVGTNYEVTYENNIDAGTASVTVKGMGAYTESGKNWKDITVYFTIQPAEQSVAFASAEVETTYGDPTFTQAATVTLIPNVSSESHGAVTYTSGNPAVATVDSTGKVTILGAGTATITASAAATQNYKGAEASYKLTVKPKDISSSDVTASQIPDQPYGGVPVTPEFSLTDSDSDITKNNLEVNVDYTFTYSNNDGEGTGKITITGTGNYAGTKEVTFKIIPWSDSQVVVTPAAITIYMGGADGYEGAVVDEDTGSITASSSLPEPGFLFTLPEMLKDALAANHADLTDITFREPDSGKEWTAEFYADGASTVYRLVPSGDQEPVRVQFTNAQGQTVTEDKFEVGENINQTLTMTLYKGDVGVIYAIYDGVQYPIRLGKSTLTVRGVTEEAQYAAVTDGNAAPAEGKPAVTAESGTTYTINGSDVPVEDASGVALLFDSIIDVSGENRTSLLENKAEDTMETLNKEPASGNRFAYSFQYLDLVDQNNGNAWVKASQDVTIYWPYPAGTNKDTEFTLLHFEGLHREMDTSEIGDQIANCTVSEVTSVKKTDTHLVLKVGSAGFSPFALVWEEKIPTYTITATSNGNGSITPAGVTTVQEGGSQSYTIQADSGYHISDVKVNGKSVGAVESYDFTDVRSNQTIEVTFARNSSGNGGGGVTTRYIIEAEAGSGGEISPDGRVSVSSGSDKTFRITADEGYEIADVIVDGKSVGAVSSYTFENVRKNHTISVTFQEAEQVADPDDTGVSGWLNTSDHIQYLSGYGGGKFGPTDNMTRAQAAQMFYNLLLDQDVPITVSFTDVAADAWYAKAVNTLASLGIVDGIGGNHYAPERAITRAEFTVIAMRFAHLDTSGENIFSDVTADAWYYDYVVGSIQYGWINGYEDGTFRPNNTITRSEVTAIVNRMLGRSADKVFVDHHADELTQFSDVPGSYWAYYEIMEAANAHDYVKDNGVEDWTRLQ